MACALPRSWRSGGRSTASRNSARPTGANAQAFHKLSGKTTRAAPATPSKMRKPVQAPGLERSVRTLGKVRETKNSESATEAREARHNLGGGQFAEKNWGSRTGAHSVLEGVHVSRLPRDFCNRVYSSFSRMGSGMACIRVGVWLSSG